MITLIDNYDSFTYNLAHYLGELGADVRVRRNDEKSADELMAEGTRAFVISPGPCDPDRAGVCLELVEKAGGKIPILGVCLGHQTIGQAYGGKVVRAPSLMHGKTSMISHDCEGVFHAIPSPFEATRYHSLVVERDSLPDCLEVTANTDDGLIMALRHKEHEVFGVQFHPESIASQHGHKLLANFMELAGVKVRPLRKDILESA
jgi:anthranilate synthase component 2